MKKLCFFLLLLFPSSLFSAIYYVDQVNGNDANNGLCISCAWKTISKVNSSAFLPDDSVLFNKGNSWAEQLTFSSSGSSGHPITISNYGTGALPIISGGTYGIYILSKSFLIIDGLNLQNVNTRAIFLFAGGGNFTDITIRNCQMSVQNTAGGACVYANVSTGNFWDNIVIQNNTMTPWGANLQQRYGINFVAGVRSFDINTNTISGAGEDGIVLEASGNPTTWSYVRNNILGGNGENSIDLKNTQYVDVQNNTCDNDGESNIIAHDDEALPVPSDLTHHIIIEGNTLSRGGQLNTPRFSIYMHYVDDSIVRYNKISSGYAGGIYVDDAESSANNNEISYNVFNGGGTGQTFQATIQLGDVVGTKVYNNMIYGQLNNGDGIYFIGGPHTTGVTIKNNIVMNEARYNLRITAAANVSLTLDNNLYFPDGAAKFSWLGVNNTFSGYRTASGQDVHGMSVDPILINPGVDFRLQITSPAINTGFFVGLIRDIIGTVVPFMNSPDIGAYEWFCGQI